MLDEPLLFFLLSFLAVTLFYCAHIRSRLRDYEDNDFSKIEGWPLRKTEALKSGLEKGHDLERLSEELHQSVASVRAKLVSMKLYNKYQEFQLGDQYISY